MVPIELRLSNFLSYGTSAPVLDFSQFHVACLSGRNGQGKSALLDAITWALWGEARKSSGTHKPDDELIRIGAQRMQVDFVFDLEADRYRVIRSYTRSKSGKSNNTTLEISIFSREDHVFRPLTAPSTRETQQRLDAILGIDYDTFINSAFLLQGRSDEFTKKKPGERKEILARILNLGRFEELALRARDREKEALDRCRQLEMECNRLSISLEKEEEWKTIQANIVQSIHELHLELEKCRAEEKILNEQIVQLDGKEKEVHSLQQSIREIDERLEQYRVDLEHLEKSIEEADRLVAQKDTIERDFSRYEALQQERDDLDQKSTLFRGIEKLIAQRENELREKKSDIEKRIHSLEVEIKSNRSSYDECVARLLEEKTIRRMLEQARQAEKQYETLSLVFQERTDLTNQMMEAERELHGLRESISGQLHALRVQMEREVEGRNSLEELNHQKDQLVQDNERLADCRNRMEEMMQKGQKLAETIKEKTGQLTAREQNLQQQKENYERFRSASNGICPTCGTELTPDHRKEVDEQYRIEIKTAEDQILNEWKWIKDKELEREQLRKVYREYQLRSEPLTGASERLAEVCEKIKQAENLVLRWQESEKRIGELQAMLDEKRFGFEVRERWKNLKQRLESIPFDNGLFEQVRTLCAQIPRYEDQLHDLELTAGKKDQLEKRIKKDEQQLSELRTSLDDGSLFGNLQAQIKLLYNQLATTGYDPARADAVRIEIKELGQAGARVKDLLNAQKNRAEWVEHRERTGKNREMALQERESKHKTIDQLTADLLQRPVLMDRLKAARLTTENREEQLRQLQMQWGEINAKLEQAGHDRVSLDEKRNELREAGSTQNLYGKLKVAFGKNGIPSLIIEETLPEIEERTNLLLDRLTDGKMSVRLETLKDKKDGGTRETLEIIIRDELGVTRTYETFSGGEAFRVNFALRIALAQLLAERNGVRVRTLVIDEGFGTQDTEGIQNLVESIQSIQEDFEKILVITHLDELKEVFPVRIEVEKHPVDGSRFEIHGI